MTDDKQVRISKLKELYSKPLGDEWVGKTYADIKDYVSELMGRSVWTHELAYPNLLISELETGDTGRAFGESLADISSKKPTILVGAPEPKED